MSQMGAIRVFSEIMVDIGWSGGWGEAFFFFHSVIFMSFSLRLSLGVFMVRDFTHLTHFTTSPPHSPTFTHSHPLIHRFSHTTATSCRVMETLESHLPSRGPNSPFFSGASAAEFINTPGVQQQLLHAGLCLDSSNTTATKETREVVVCIVADCDHQALECKQLAQENIDLLHELALLWLWLVQGVLPMPAPVLKPPTPVAGGPHVAMPSVLLVVMDQQAEVLKAVCVYLEQAKSSFAATSKATLQSSVFNKIHVSKDVLTGSRSEYKLNSLKAAHWELAGMFPSLEEAEAARMKVVVAIEQCVKVVWLVVQLGSWEAAKAFLRTSKTVGRIDMAKFAKLLAKSSSHQEQSTSSFSGWHYSPMRSNNKGHSHHCSYSPPERGGGGSSQAGGYPQHNQFRNGGSQSHFSDRWPHSGHSAKSGHGAGSFNSFQGVCYHCQKVGHIAQFCPSLLAAAPSSAPQ